MPLIPILLSLVGQFAPRLIDALVGPKAGDVASKVIDVAQAVSGTTDQAAAVAALAADPGKLAAFQAQLAQITLEHVQAEYADTAGARAMALAGGVKSPTTWGAPIISFVVMGLLSAVTLGFAPPPGPALLQVLVGAVSLVLGYWLGSSKRDTTTDALLANSIPAHLAGGAASRPLS
jgi:hypothetical protein